MRSLGLAHRMRLLGLAHRGRSSMVELQPSKLVVRVRFPSPAPLVRARFRRSGIAFRHGGPLGAARHFASLRGLPRDECVTNAGRRSDAGWGGWRGVAAHSPRLHPAALPAERFIGVRSPSAFRGPAIRRRRRAKRRRLAGSGRGRPGRRAPAGRSASVTGVPCRRAPRRRPDDRGPRHGDASHLSGT